MAYPGELAYYQARSGLPADRTLAEHKRAYFIAGSGAPADATIGEAEYAFYLSQTGLSRAAASFVDARYAYYRAALPGNAGTVGDLLTAFFANPPADGGASISSTSSAITQTGSSLTITTPAGAAAGDVLIAVLASQSTKSASVDWTAPGWARTDDLFNTQALAGDRVHGTYVLQLGAAPDASYTFDRVAGGSGRNIGVLLLVKGPESATPFDAVSADYDGGLGSVGNARSVTAMDTVGGLELFYFYANYSAGQTHLGGTPPAGFAERANITTSDDVAGTGRSYLWVGSRNVVAPSTGTSEFVSVGTPTSPVASHLVLKGGARTMVAYGVADMEADYASGPVRMAHRLGSLVYSEFTSVAAAGSRGRGYRILEFSVRYSSDGVAVGMHDATLDRVTALVGDVSAQTWATLAATPVDVFAADGGMVQSLAAFLTANGNGEQVLIIEDKTYANIPAMLAQIETALGSQAIANARVVFKGNVAGSWAPIVKARGYKIWSYCTGAEIDTLAASPYLGDIDYVALNHDATQAQWATAAGLGKPLWAHVIATPAQAAAAAEKAKIAGKRLAGLQVGAVNTVFA